MAISKENFSETEGSVKLTNGDFQALLQIARDYNLTDESDVFAFALGLLNKASGKPIMIESEDGHILRFIPSDNLRGKK